MAAPRNLIGYRAWRRLRVRAALRAPADRRRCSAPRVLALLGRAPKRCSFSCCAVLPCRSFERVRDDARRFWLLLWVLDAPASCRAIATACLRLFTLPPLPPRLRFSSPCLYSCITRPTVLRLRREVFAMLGLPCPGTFARGLFYRGEPRVPQFEGIEATSRAERNEETSSKVHHVSALLAAKLSIFSDGFAGFLHVIHPLSHHLVGQRDEFAARSACDLISSCHL